MRLLSLVCLLSLASCGDEDCCTVRRRGGPADRCEHRVRRGRARAGHGESRRRLLFVIDDSPTMLDKQTNLKNNFPNFINVLNTSRAGCRTSTSASSRRTSARRAPTTRIPVPASALVRARARRAARTASCRRTARRSITGRVHQRHEEHRRHRAPRTTPATLATRSRRSRALGAAAAASSSRSKRRSARSTTTRRTRAFCGPNANLAIIVVTDEDDCSLRTRRCSAPTRRRSARCSRSAARDSASVRRRRRDERPDEHGRHQGSVPLERDVGVPDAVGIRRRSSGPQGGCEHVMFGGDRRRPRRRSRSSSARRPAAERRFRPSRTRARTRAPRDRGRRPGGAHRAVPRRVPEAQHIATICQQDLSGHSRVRAASTLHHRQRVHRAEPRGAE